MEVAVLPDLEADEDENEPKEEGKLRENGPRRSGLGREGCDKGEMSSGDSTKCCCWRPFSWASGEASIVRREGEGRGRMRTGRAMEGEDGGEGKSDGSGEGEGGLKAGLLRAAV
jgi:hypothetical protein